MLLTWEVHLISRHSLNSFQCIQVRVGTGFFWTEEGYDFVYFQDVNDQDPSTRGRPGNGNTWFLFPLPLVQFLSFSCILEEIDQMIGWAQWRIQDFWGEGHQPRRCGR